MRSPPRLAAMQRSRSFAASAARPFAIRSSAVESGSSGSKRTFAVIDDDKIALLRFGAERHHAAVDPHFRNDGLAGKYGRGKARVESGDPVRIVFAHGRNDGPAGGAVRTESVQDRARKAGHLRHFGIAVERIAVA